MRPRPRYNPEIARQFCDCRRLNAVQPVRCKGLCGTPGGTRTPNLLIRNQIGAQTFRCGYQWRRDFAVRPRTRPRTPPENGNGQVVRRGPNATKPQLLLRFLSFSLRGAEGIRTPDPLTASQVLCQAELQPLAEPECIKSRRMTSLVRTRSLGHLPRAFRARSRRVSRGRRHG
jgi:hypothetical protein